MSSRTSHPQEGAVFAMESMHPIIAASRFTPLAAVDRVTVRTYIHCQIRFQSGLGFKCIATGSAGNFHPDVNRVHAISFHIPTPTAIFAHPPFFRTRSVDAGYFDKSPAGRRGRTTSSPPQLGHSPDRMSDEHFAQYVHSKEHIRASADSGGKSVSQHSQLGLS